MRSRPSTARDAVDGPARTLRLLEGRPQSHARVGRRRDLGEGLHRPARPGRHRRWPRPGRCRSPQPAARSPPTRPPIANAAAATAADPWPSTATPKQRYTVERCISRLKQGFGLATRCDSIRPTAGSCWAPRNRPQRIPATYHRTHGVTYFHGCYSIGNDTLWGVNRRHKGAAQSLAALKSIRAIRPDGAPICVIMDNLSAHKGTKIRAWAENHRVELCLPRPTPPGPTR